MTNSRKRRAKTGDGRGPGTAAKKPHNKSPRPTPLSGREHVGGGTRCKSPSPHRARARVYVMYVMYVMYSMYVIYASWIAREASRACFSPHA